jgi:mRNA-degrading endonuclease RelE of RelBE toxin-antitoxin system
VKIHFHENFDKDLSKVGDAILAKQIRKLILRL